MKATHRQLVPSVGYVHTKEYGDGETWISWVKVQSERHAERLIPWLHWNEQFGSAGCFFRHTWYDSKNKRLVSRAGYDV